MGREKWWKFFGKQWTNILYDFLISNEFKKIGAFIKEQKQKGRIITPRENVIFRAFKECSWSNLHTVIISHEPYITNCGVDQFTADGLAFSARYSYATPWLLQRFYQVIDEEIYDGDGENLGLTNDLTYLANQGILLLNASLTASQQDKSGTHVLIWKNFITYVLQAINRNKSSVGFILMGDVAKSYKHLLSNQSFYILECEHPIETLDRGGRKWTAKNAFSALNSWHKTFNNINIEWSEKDNSGTNEQERVSFTNSAGIF